MAKVRAVVRQWTLLRTLAQQNQGLTVREMAHHMAVAERTIRRDINLFVAAGIPLREVRTQRGKKHWRVEDRSLTIPNYGIEEALVLVVAEMLLAPLKGSRLHAAAQKCRVKLLTNLSRADLSTLEHQAAALSIEWPANENHCGSPHILDALWDALTLRASVKMKFHDEARNHADATVAPVKFVLANGRLCVETQGENDGKRTVVPIHEIANVERE